MAVTLEIGRLKAKVGDLTMANELLEAKIEHLEAAALWHGGGRGHEPTGLALHQPALRRAAGDPGLGPSRATLYRHRRATSQRPRRRPGPLGPMPDAALVEAIRELLAESPFHGEGYRKIWARLRFAGIRTSKRRVLRLTREHGLQAPAGSAGRMARRPTTAPSERSASTRCGAPI